MYRENNWLCGITPKHYNHEFASCPGFFLFQHIKQVSHEGASLADVISEILYLSSDSVYGGVSGEKRH